MSKIPGNLGKGFAHLDKLGSLLRGMVYANELGAPALANASAVLLETALGDGEITEVAEDINSPDIPRNLSITGVEGGETALEGDVVIEGTNILDREITETIALSGTDTVAGSKAFKTVTRIILPERKQAGDKVKVGTGKLLGLHQPLDSEDEVIVAFLNKAIQSAVGKVTTDSDAVEKNTIDLSAGTYNGTKRASVLLKG